MSSCGVNVFAYSSLEQSPFFSFKCHFQVYNHGSPQLSRLLIFFLFLFFFSPSTYSERTLHRERGPDVGAESPQLLGKPHEYRQSVGSLHCWRCGGHVVLDRSHTETLIHCCDSFESPWFCNLIWVIDR